MKRIYACLIGKWTDITDNGAIDGHENLPTYVDELLCYEGGSKVSKLNEYDYINVQYNNKNYRIHPSMIQIVDE